MDEILTIIIEIVGFAIGVCLACLWQRVMAYLKSKLNEQEQSELEKFVASLVSAAEQTLKEEDQDGSVRREYVQQMLIEAGYELTDAIMALVESKVFELNIATRK